MICPELSNLASNESYYLNINCTFYFLIPRVNTANTCFEGRSRHSVWHHVIICLFYSIHISLRTHGRDVKAECMEHVLRRGGGECFKDTKKKKKKKSESKQF